jgi:CheY-like chemotaxis protein
MKASLIKNKPPSERKPSPERLQKMQPPNNQPAWEFLIVCKDAQVHRVLAGAVHAVGGISHYFSDSASALTYVTRRKLDGIFIDTRTEGALSLVGNVRRGGSNRFAVIFACVSEDQEVSRLLNAGVNFVLHKPLDSREIEVVLTGASQMIETERRRYMRHPLAVPVVLKAADMEYKAVTVNISRGGMAVRCSDTFTPGSAVHYILKLPRTAEVLGRGQVAWSNTQSQMGIRFYLMGDQDKETLWTWMERA